MTCAISFVRILKRTWLSPIPRAYVTRGRYLLNVLTWFYLKLNSAYITFIISTFYSRFIVMRAKYYGNIVGDFLGQQRIIMQHYGIGRYTRLGYRNTICSRCLHRNIWKCNKNMCVYRQRLQWANNLREYLHTYSPCFVIRHLCRRLLTT